MTYSDIIDEIKLELTGGVLELEIDDDAIQKIIQKALRELERFWDETTLITVPFASCIDYSTMNPKVSSIVRVYRIQGVGDSHEGSSYNLDPMYAQQWMLFSNGGTMYNLNDYVMNYASWMTLSQIRNTMYTDMSFKDDSNNSKLYISNMYKG